jgi:hypothetical protein
MVLPHRRSVGPISDEALNVAFGAELEVRIQLSPAVSQQTFGSSQDDALVRSHDLFAIEGPLGRKGSDRQSARGTILHQLTRIRLPDRRTLPSQAEGRLSLIEALARKPV